MTAQQINEYAKQKAIAFIAWIEKNNWWGDIDDGEKTFTETRWSKDSANPEYLTTEQLFDLYDKDNL
jgi:hypothetical protein